MSRIYDPKVVYSNITKPTTGLDRIETSGRVWIGIGGEVGAGSLEDFNGRNTRHSCPSAGWWIAAWPSLGLVAGLSGLGIAEGLHV